jgi:hypothetical protein
VHNLQISPTSINTLRYRFVLDHDTGSSI